MLRLVSVPVASVASASSVLEDLRDTLHDFQRSHGFGRGISAIQIGESCRLIYIEFQGVSYCLHNPEWESLSERKFVLWDDCFSFPELLVKLERSQQCAVRYIDETGAERRLEAEGALSELLQHEMDHLDGILAVDRALDRESFRTRVEHERQTTLKAVS